MPGIGGDFLILGDFRELSFCGTCGPCYPIFDMPLLINGITLMETIKIAYPENAANLKMVLSVLNFLAVFVHNIKNKSIA